ncbi:MAG: glycosyl hydrolase family 2 protein [Saccharofermentanales bacterium]
MNIINEKSFENPPAKYRVNPIVHGWPKQYRTDFMQAIKDYGFGGVVTNVPFSDGHTANPDNLADFGKMVNELDEKDLSFWIYDENGYPSGYAGGKTLIGHPEMEAKGLYMRRYVAYEPRHIRFRLDEESDKIVWAAKYPIDTPAMHNSYIVPEKMEPVKFTEDFVECDLLAKEAFFVFCVKPAYEGSHCTHNVCSYSRYINVMNPAAVRRFIDLNLEPIAAVEPDAFRKAFAVFTDEPSLQVGYARDYEMWPYALAPWVDSLFDDFHSEYGFSLLPFLPYIFEGHKVSYPYRIKFYKLVGKLIARAYTGQLTEWCESHGGRFSGHYLGEETITSHVKDYGDNIEVMKAASYPGIDVLHCYPEIYQYNTAKHAQMVARKKGTNGMMVEICPFFDVENFRKDPVENMTGVMGLLYLGGVRITNSYFAADYTKYDPDKFPGMKGYMDRSQANAFNGYVGRISYMLDGIKNDCNTFVYYGLEDVQAKMRPEHTEFSGPESGADRSTVPLTKMIYEAGFDFYYADHEDIVDAAKSLMNGTPLISGCVVKTIIIPKLDVMYEDTLDSLAALQESGVTVLFLETLPVCGTEVSSADIDYSDKFTPCSQADILEHLVGRGDPFTVICEKAMIIKGRFVKDGHEMYFVDNNSRFPADVVFNHKNYEEATLYNPVTGEIKPVKMGETVTIQSFRGVFILF